MLVALMNRRFRPLTRPAASQLSRPPPSLTAGLWGFHISPARVTPGKSFFHELEELSPVRSGEEEPGEVPSGTRDTLCKPLSHRVATHADTDDRDGFGGGLGSPGSGHTSCDDHIHLEPHELLCGPDQIRLTLGRSSFENQVLSLAIAELGQGVAKREGHCALAQDRLTDAPDEHADSRWARRCLCLCAEPKSERDGRKRSRRQSYARISILGLMASLPSDKHCSSESLPHFSNAPNATLSGRSERTRASGPLQCEVRRLSHLRLVGPPSRPIRRV